MARLHEKVYVNRAMSYLVPPEFPPAPAPTRDPATTSRGKAAADLLELLAILIANVDLPAIRAVWSQDAQVWFKAEAGRTGPYLVPLELTEETLLILVGANLTRDHLRITGDTITVVAHSAGEGGRVNHTFIFARRMRRYRIVYQFNSDSF